MSGVLSQTPCGHLLDVGDSIVYNVTNWSIAVTDMISQLSTIPAVALGGTVTVGGTATLPQ
jgi:hypothetical protein